MKIEINKDLFLEKINLASKFASNKLSSSTSLQGVFLKGEKKQIHFYSTNLNYYYHSFLNTEENHQFEIVIEPKKISEFLSLLSSGKIEVEFKEKSVIISQGKTKGEFSLFSPDEFPLPPRSTSEKQKIQTSFLKETLPLLLFSASTDETRPVLTGINFVARESTNQIVATDGFRLSLLNLKKETPFSSMIVPSGFLFEMSRLIRDEKEVLFNFQEEEKLLTFYLGDNEISTRLIEGDYPPYEKVIPVEKKTSIVLDKGEFLRNVRLVSVFARDFSNIIILDVGRDGIKLSPKTGGSDTNVAYQESKVDGEEIRIAFNFKFVIDFLNNVPSEKIIIELLRPNSPAAFKGEKNEDFLHIIMPVRIQE
ncbi:MAG: polymerase III subunit beta protein [Candidatus Roizmanbacteria bacterium GW2011_GWC2_37_13]|uniref:Beta sliding clamp n=1 Tax=Candidatus Roizmanbacteria bacterium GW2011_GWC2_37_13 TaxID=1618486 RepID=A0A0G0IPZ3_9BACT|nr:MAG: polymerase III subunit beta protein [Candidatus Roizmanbacteria bacterium GW2011_GWC1_37_12]KKQ26219.1 MAG: polymerase III subunit beta protein [Candidatus Roizmanbacteria bacterium GW2011_GWC2_37_13]